MKRTIDNEEDEIIVSFDETPELKEAVYERVLQFFLKHHVFNGESVIQCDDAYIASSDFLSELVDEFGFEVKYDEE